MIATFLAGLWASKMFRQGLALAAAFFAGWLLIHTYNGWVTEEALAGNDKAWQKKLDTEIDKHLDYVAALEAARAKAIAEGAADAKAKEDKHRLEIAKLTEAYNNRKRSDVNVGVLKSITTASDSSCGPDQAKCIFIRELGRSYSQCEQGLGRAIDIAKQAASGYAQCSETVRALK